MKERFRVVIPAGGRSSRSGLNYPKTLYRLGGVPILVRIMNLVEPYDPCPVVIINPAHRLKFEQVLAEFGVQAELVLQEEPKGMGDAILRADAKLEEGSQVILIWSDIPLLHPTTLRHLISCHTACRNNFSLVTSIGSNCYTIVEREDGAVQSVKETRALGIEPAGEGERDIGVFVFRKQPVFSILKESANQSATPGNREHGFLYAVETLVAKGYKVEGYPIALPADVLSFNTPEDLAQIEKKFKEEVNNQTVLC